ncbi:MAG: hypothetical protein ACI9OJ_000881 [Myxococcota bacterium]
MASRTARRIAFLGVLAVAIIVAWFALRETPETESTESESTDHPERNRRRPGTSGSGPSAPPSKPQFHRSHPTPSAVFPIRTIALEMVSNASGMVVAERGGKRVIITVDEVPEWEGSGPPPPLMSWNDPLTGKQLGGTGRAGEWGEVEALALRDGRVIFPYKTGPQRVVIRDGNQDIVLTDDAAIQQLTNAVRTVAKGPWFFELEGLAWTGKGFELVVAALLGDAEDGPISTRAVLRAQFGPEGGITRLSPPLRDSTGALRTDYAAALHVLDDGRALIPGFFKPNVGIYDWTGAEVAVITVDTRRIEGIHFDTLTNELLMTRECVGLGGDCAPGIHFGVPAYIMTLPAPP